MSHLSKTLEIRSSPHIASGLSTDNIMFQVVVALMPTALFAVYLFGAAGLATMLVSVCACVLTEHLLCRWAGRTTTVSDWSAAVTGLLYGMTLPPNLPWWMTVVGAVFGIGVAKTLFGGLGYNCFNPALVGRAFLQAAFPAAMTSWPAIADDRFTSLPNSALAWPFMQPAYDGLSGATPLSQWKFDRLATSSVDLFLGTVPGSTGETSACLILLGGIYLAARNMLNWRIPVAILSTVAGLSLILQWLDGSRYAGPAFMLFSGGLMLGAVFMATDMVASPMTHPGCVLYGILIGVLVVVIRVWGGMPEGVMYAILLGNAVSPHIDAWIQPRVYGERQSRSSGATPQAETYTLDSKIPPTASRPGSVEPSATPEVTAKVVEKNPLKASSSATKQAAADIRMVATLLTTGAVCGLAIVSAFLITKPIIQRNQIAQRQAAVFRVLPGATSSQAFRWSDDSGFQPVSPETVGSDIVYAGYNDHQHLVGIAMTGQATGYQDVVQLAYGYSLESQTILAFQVLASRETPGLGDRVETDKDFLRNFDRLDVQVSPDGSSLVNPIQFVKPGEKTTDWQIDGISGATITSRTVAKILSEGTRNWVPKLWQRRADFEQKIKQDSN